MDERKMQQAGSGGEHIFDDGFHVSAYLCKELLIPLTNEAFGLKIPRGTDVVFLSELQTVIGEDGKSRKRVMDTLIAFPEAPGLNPDSRFHFECESRDGNIILRIVEYVLMDGIKSARKSDDGGVDVYLPRSAVIYLKSGKKTPGKAKIRLHTPGGDVSYIVPSIRLGSYSLDEIFDKELYILIPYYLLRYRDRLSGIGQDEEQRRELAEELNEIDRRLQASFENGKLSLETEERIRDQFHRVLDYLLKDDQNIRQEVTGMDNSYWDRDWSIIDDPLFYKEEGREERLVELICKKLRKGKDVPQIADEVEEDEIRVKMICDIAERFEPDYETEKVFEAVQKELIEA